MTEEEKQQYREKLRQALAPARKETFQHFASEQEKQAHLAQVKEAQESGAPF